MDKLKFETPDMVSGNIDKIAVLVSLGHYRDAGRGR